MKNFLINGSVSKEFIQSNKKELQKYIKGQIHTDKRFSRFSSNEPTQSVLERNLNDSTADVTHADRRRSSVDLPDLKNKKGKVFAATLPSVTKTKSMSPVADDNTLTQSVSKRPSHQLPEKAFHAVNDINPRVIETWLNETLADAQHLDIPGCILKPAYKLPINRYGIDRFTMTNSGIHTDDVDRIYRCLFVYSVGFFEMLKDLLA